MIDFVNIYDHIIPIEDFDLKWRFSFENSSIISSHLSELNLLDSQASKFLWDYIADSGLHNDFPFKVGFFKEVDTLLLSEESTGNIKKWLYNRGMPFSRDVFLSWQPDTAMIISWKLLIKYYDDFYYSISDDLTVIDASLSWALLFFHKDELYYGSNKYFLK